MRGDRVMLWKRITETLCDQSTIYSFDRTNFSPKNDSRLLWRQKENNKKSLPKAVMRTVKNKDSDWNQVNLCNEHQGSLIKS
jgi:hypothetical protein